MANPEFSVRHVTTRSKLPATLVQGRAYFVDDEGSIVVNHGSGGITYGKTKQTDTNTAAIGTVSQLATPTKNNLTQAVNEAYEYSRRRTFSAMGKGYFNKSLNHYYRPRRYAKDTDENLAYIERLVAAVSSGNFDDIHLGDSFYIKMDLSSMYFYSQLSNVENPEFRLNRNVPFRVVGFNHWWNIPTDRSDRSAAYYERRPHIVIMHLPEEPENGAIGGDYGSTVSISDDNHGGGKYADITTKGYLNSSLRSDLQTIVLPQIRATFGTAHMMAMPDYFSSEVTDGKVTAHEWVQDSYLEIASYQQFTGNNLPDLNGEYCTHWAQFPLLAQTRCEFLTYTLFRDIAPGGFLTLTELGRLLKTNWRNLMGTYAYEALIPYYFTIC